MTEKYKDLGEMNMQSLMALRAITGDNLRATEKTVDELSDLLFEIHKEITSRGTTAE